MSRIDPEIRRQAVITAALELFYRDGFDSVRVDDILAQVGLSKGGFYHHFKSREDILRQIVVDETVGTVSSLDGLVIEDDPINALTQLFVKGSTSLGAGVGVLGTLSSFSSKSIYLDELGRQFALHLKPFIVRVIEQGIASDIFRSVDSEATAEMVLAVNDHGNRRAVLGGFDAQQLKAYNFTAISALARHLGIDNELQTLLSALES